MPNVNNKEKHGPCTVAGCNEWACAVGLCNKHYLRNRKYGDPTSGRDLLPRGLTNSERFKRIGWTVVDSGCWEWNGGTDSSGYGQFFETLPGTNRHRRIGAHRIALELKIGRTLSGDGAKKEYSLHTCDNRICVNPDHLFVGTHLDNMKDKVRKGRQPSKLSREDVAMIFELRAQGMLQRDIADKFRIHQAYVSEILLGKKRLQEEQ